MFIGGGYPGGQCEHSWFVMGLEYHDRFNLACAAKGPLNARPGKKHPPPKPSRSARLVKMLGPPLHLAPSISSHPCLAAATGSAEAAPSASPIAASQGTFTDSQQSVNECKCIARTWGEGVGAQCTNARKVVWQA